MNINNIVIIGAGAMGAAYAAMFTEAGGFQVSFAARGARLDRLQKEPITVNGKSYTIKALHPNRFKNPADLLIVAVKHHHLRDILEDIQTLVGEDTIILSVMNGIESEEIISEACGSEKVLPAIAVGIDAVREDGEFRYSNPGKIIFGHSSGAANDRLERLQDALNRAEIPNEISHDIMRTIWWKFMINVGVNQTSAILRAPYGVFQSNEDANALTRMLMLEVVSLAEKADINLVKQDVDDWDRIVNTLAPDGKTSMLQDVEAGRKTEVEMFAGQVVALGEKYQAPTPVNLALLHMIRAIESGYLKK